MVGQEVGRGVDVVAAGRFQIGIALHVGQEARGAERIEAGARRNADADAVGFEFLRAREAGERQLGFGERQRAHLRIAQHVADHVADQRRLPRLVFADGGVARDDVAHLMRQHRREFGLVVGEREQPARDVELAVRQREGVDRGRIEDGHLVFLLRLLRRRHQAVDQLRHHRVQLGIVVDAAIGREDARVLALLRRRRRNLRGRIRKRELRQLERDRLVVRAAAASRQHERERERGAGHPVCRSARRAHCRVSCAWLMLSSANSICSGASASITGPRRCSNQPRTLMRRPSSRFGSRPASLKMR